MEKSGLLLRCKLERDDAHEALEGSRAFESFGLSAEQRYPTGGVALLTSCGQLSTLLCWKAGKGTPPRLAGRLIAIASRLSAGEAEPGVTSPAALLA